MEFEMIDPTVFPDWDDILLCSGDNSFFHSSAWAKALSATYGYKPVYFSVIENTKLVFLMPFMEISSPLTGKRGVSLPFSDRCEPYSPLRAFMKEAVQTAIWHGKRKNWKYLEWRDSRYFDRAAVVWKSFRTHDLDLGRTEPEILSLLEKSNLRNIKKALRNGVTVKADGSRDSLKEFYRLNCATRRRQGLPPQPIAFFKNVFEHILSKGFGNIISAIHDGRTIAAALFFRFGSEAIFKYGASDSRFLELRPNNLILWEAIELYRSKGCRNLNLGRTEADNAGLLRFKRAWGTYESTIHYYRHDIRTGILQDNPPKSDRWLKAGLSRAPKSILRLIGQLAYKHIG